MQINFQNYEQRHIRTKSDGFRKEMLNAIWNIIPEQDRKDMKQTDVLFVLDMIDDFLIENDLLVEGDEDITYLEGEVDETEQMQFIYNAAQEAGKNLTMTQIQIILDAELQYGIQEGYYTEED